MSSGCAAIACAELGAVEHGQVGALAGRRHQVRGIAEERHPGHAVPSVPVRERVDHPRDRRGLAVGDQRGELRRPPVELGRDPGGRGGGVGEVDAGDPLGRAVQLDVGVQDAPRLAVGDDPLPRGEREHRAAADRRGRRRVPLVGVVQVGLDERGADVLGRRRPTAAAGPSTRRRRRRRGGSLVTVDPSAKVSSCRPSPSGRTPATLRPHWIVPSGSESSRMRRRSPRSTSGRPPCRRRARRAAPRRAGRARAWPRRPRG